jgi:diguanylate cyclase (GGDEF)-like protein/PAS domain S-box-containing protein
VSAQKADLSATGAYRASAVRRRLSSLTGDSLFYQLPNPSIVYSRSNLIVRALNSAGEVLLGYTEAQLRGNRLQDILLDLTMPAEGELGRTVSRHNFYKAADDRILDIYVTSGEIVFDGEDCRIDVMSGNPREHFDEQSAGTFSAEVAGRMDAERGLRESQQRYKSLFANSPYAIIRFGNDGRVQAVNSSAETVTGYQAAELIGRHYRHIVNPVSHKIARNNFESAARGVASTWDLQIRNSAGRSVPINGVNVPTVVDGEVVGCYAIIRDMSEQYRLHALIRGENEVLSLITTRQPLDHVLYVIARTVGRQADDMVCAILLLDQDGKHLTYAAAPGLPTDYRNALDGVEVGPNAGVCGRAVLTGKRVATIDVRNDLGWRIVRDLALDGGILACCATPIISSKGHALGVIVAYYNESREPTDWEERLLDRSCNLARIAIEREASEQELNIVQRALESVTVGIVISDARIADNPVIYVNKSFEEITGYSQAEIVGKNCRLLQTSETEPEAIQRIAEAICAHQDCMVVLLNRRKDGTNFWNALTLSPIRDSYGRLTHWIGIISDVTNRKKVSEVIHDSEERFRQLIENTSDIISIVEADGVIRYQSPSVERVLGLTPAGMIGKQLKEFVHPEDEDEVARLFEKLLETPGAAVAVEARYRHADGHWRSIEQVATNLTGQPGVRGILLNSRDVTERRQEQLKLNFLAHHDPLTNLPNRSVFDDRLNAAIAAAARTGTKVAVLFLDLDRFKIINDTLGHRVGDQLLATVAQRLTNAIRECDLVARWGGDEFTLILPKITTTNDAVKASQRIIASLSAPIKCLEHELYVTGTIGISIYPTGGQDAETLLRNADTAMYRAKERGKNYFQVYKPDMNIGAVERLTLEGALRKALDRQEFVLHYQPQIELRTGKITGIEALVRWQHPQHGLIAPIDFIKLAEDTGLIIPLGEWVLNTACRQAALWHQQCAPLLRMAVNLSATQLARKEFTKTVERAVRDSSIDPRLLELELTESVLMNDEQSTKPLHDLRSMLIQLSVDDFGTGYSSFMYLKRYPVSSLKIDRSFISNIGTEGDDATIVRSMIEMAHNLRLRVVAEGVETAEEFRFLTAHDCDEMQGYYFSAPLPAEALSLLLAKVAPSPAE